MTPYTPRLVCLNGGSSHREGKDAGEKGQVCGRVTDRDGRDHYRHTVTNDSAGYFVLSCMNR